MADARSRGWGWPGDPGSIAERTYRRLHVVTIAAGGVRLAVRREVAALFGGFIADLVATGYRLDVRPDDWGFANRDIRGRPGVKSNHSWGLAVDLNAVDNPMTTGAVRTDMPPGTGFLAAKWGLRWGANYSGTRKDAMHFEFEGTPGDVGRYPLVERRPVPPPAPPPPALSPGPTPTAYPEDAMRRYDLTSPLDAAGNGYIDVPILAADIVSIVANGDDPSGPAGDVGYKPVPRFSRLAWGAGTRIVIMGGPPAGGVAFVVWTATG